MILSIQSMQRFFMQRLDLWTKTSIFHDSISKIQSRLDRAQDNIFDVLKMFFHPKQGLVHVGKRERISTRRIAKRVGSKHWSCRVDWQHSPVRKGEGLLSINKIEFSCFVCSRMGLAPFYQAWARCSARDRHSIILRVLVTALGALVEHSLPFIRRTQLHGVVFQAPVSTLGTFLVYGCTLSQFPGFLSVFFCFRVH